MLLCNIIKHIYLSTPEHGVIQEPLPHCQGIALLISGIIFLLHVQAFPF